MLWNKFQNSSSIYSINLQAVYPVSSGVYKIHKSEAWRDNTQDKRGSVAVQMILTSILCMVQTWRFE